MAEEGCIWKEKLASDTDFCGGPWQRNMVFSISFQKTEVS